VHPLVVAITGSYGKTSTKNHLADLLSGDGGVVATPKSFNNRAGLSRAINENLEDSTRIFIAEMGTYGPGEIRELCQWCAPEVAVVTAIGPVHLERMKSLDVIESAKFEITERARVVIVNIDDPRLAHWPARLGDRRVRTAASVSTNADVRVVSDAGRWRVVVEGLEVASLDLREFIGTQFARLEFATSVPQRRVAKRDFVGQLATSRHRRRPTRATATIPPIAHAVGTAHRSTPIPAVDGVTVIFDPYCDCRAARMSPSLRPAATMRSISWRMATELGALL
jgi:UDP-N-acetylmuramoylalanine-D-glutamate ligase